MGHPDKARAAQRPGPEFVRNPWQPVDTCAIGQRLQAECTRNGIVDYYTLSLRTRTLARELADALAKVTGSRQKPQEGCRIFECSMDDSTVLVEFDGDASLVLAVYLGGAWLDVDRMPDRYVEAWAQQVQAQLDAEADQRGQDRAEQLAADRDAA